MKIRNGFVSNSSSSSFVVTYRERPDYTRPNSSRKPEKLLLSKEQVKALRKEGFKLSHIDNPYFVGTTVETENIKTRMRDYKWYSSIHMTHSVTCNQDDVIYVLLKNKIPFVALCHYDQELFVWDGKSVYFCQTDNNIDWAIRFGPKNLNRQVKEINVIEWMTDYESWTVNL